MALIPIVQALFDRDLRRLYQEISLYPNEASLWLTAHQINNSAGNLCLHLMGNLHTYIGATLGNTGYVRHREREFSDKNIPQATLLAQIEATRLMVEATLMQLHEADLPSEYPLLVFTEKTSTAYLLVHLTTHLGYHLGQINYHRRLIDGCTNVE